MRPIMGVYAEAEKQEIWYIIISSAPDPNRWREKYIYWTENLPFLLSKHLFPYNDM